MSTAALSYDYDIRAGIVRNLIADGVPRRDILHEIPLDTASSGGRVDVVFFHDNLLRAIEIKSGRDRLTRLGEQLKRYRRAFDYIAVVHDTVHSEKINYNIGNCGLWAWSSEDAGFVCRYAPYHKAPAKIIPDLLEREIFARSHHTCVADVARLLWRDEALRVAHTLGAECSTRAESIRWIGENCSLKVLRPLAIDELRAREPNKWAATFWARFGVA